MSDRTQLRLGRTLQTLSPRLRTAPANTQGNTLHPLRHPDDKQTHQARNFITPSRGGKFVESAQAKRGKISHPLHAPGAEFLKKHASLLLIVRKDRASYAVGHFERESENVPRTLYSRNAMFSLDSQKLQRSFALRCIGGMVLLCTFYLAFSSAENCKIPAAQRAGSKSQEGETSATLIRELVLEGKAEQASGILARSLAEAPHSVPLLTARAEAELRLGEPWLATSDLNAVIGFDPCYARAHLILSRIDRLDSRYASERQELQAAHDIDPDDSEIRHEFNRVITPANDVVSVQNSLATSPDLSLEIRRQAEESARDLLSLLSENSQTCRKLPTGKPGTIPMLASRSDGKSIDAYQVEVTFPNSHAALRVDTAGSGLFISQAIAEKNGFRHEEGAPAGTVLADKVAIGPYEFHECTVGVASQPLPGNGEGSVSTDLFSEFLITLDFPRSEVDLVPLPVAESVLPADRSQSLQQSGYRPVYHHQNYMLVPVLLNSKQQRLFLLDTGLRSSTMRIDLAHSISKTKINFTNAVQTRSGPPLQVYRDGFDFKFANLVRSNQEHVVAFDTTEISSNIGMQLGGMLGLDVLRTAAITLDYRDGLIKAESTGENTKPLWKHESESSKALVAQSQGKACSPIAQEHLPVSSTIVAKTDAVLDLDRVSIGQILSLQVLLSWKTSECEIRAGSHLYGHITSENAPGSKTISVAVTFEEGDCLGEGKKPLNLQLVGLLPAPGERVALHDAMPTQVGGSGRQISDTSANMGLANDQNLNESSLPAHLPAGGVLGIPHLELGPTAGPACSALLTSNQRHLTVGTGTRFLLMLQ